MKDTQEILNCPACGKVMHKIKMKSGDVFLDVCLDGCGGIYFDNRELEKFDEQHEDMKELTEAYKGRTFEQIDDSIDRVCPACASNFVKNYVSIKKEILVDECYSCGATFLDFGELEGVRAQHAAKKGCADAGINTAYGNDLNAELDQLDKRVQKFRASKRYKIIAALGKMFNS